MISASLLLLFNEDLLYSIIDSEPPTKSHMHKIFAHISLFPRPETCFIRFTFSFMYVD